MIAPLTDDAKRCKEKQEPGAYHSLVDTSVIDGSTSQLLHIKKPRRVESEKCIVNHLTNFPRS